MSKFYPNYFSGELMDSQFANYMQDKSHVKDITDAIYQSKEDLLNIQNSLHKSDETFGLFDNISQHISGLSEYLDDINIGISELSSEMSRISGLLEWNFSILIEEHRITNRYLGNIEQLLRIPNSQKQRLFHIEEGLKYYKVGLSEGVNSPIFNQAKEEFSEALKLRRSDYVSLHRLGMIYFMCPSFIDFEAAEKLFLQAAKEAEIEYKAGGTTTSNSLNPIDTLIEFSATEPQLAAAEAYLFAGRACYNQKKFEEAYDNTIKALEFNHNLLRARFESIKYAAAFGLDEFAKFFDQPEEFIQQVTVSLSQLIKNDPTYYQAALSDPDLVKDKRIRRKLADHKKAKREFLESHVYLISENVQQASMVLQRSLRSKEEDEIRSTDFSLKKKLSDLAWGVVPNQFKQYEYDAWKEMLEWDVKALSKIEGSLKNDDYYSILAGCKLLEEREKQVEKMGNALGRRIWQ